MSTKSRLGFWGCGAFGGDRLLMTTLQSLAAEMAGIHRLAGLGFEWGVSDGN
ncbi:MAG: hypothetical protein WEE66_04010 [Actinomycetota bacterium]